MTNKKKSKPSTNKSPRNKLKPAKGKKGETHSGQDKSGNLPSGGGFTLSLNGDRSLQAFKDFVRAMTLSLFPDAEDTLTEEEWVRRWKGFWANADSAAEEKKKKGKSKDEDALKEKWKNMSLEERYPGITEQIHRFENAKLPICPNCGSEDTASVQVGIIGRTMNIAASTRKFHLVPNMSYKNGEYYCNKCGKSFE